MELEDEARFIYARRPIFARVRGTARFDWPMSLPPPNAATSPTPLDLAWTELETNWGDEQAHRRFIALCAMQGALPTAGRLYREVRDSDPTRSELAKRQIDAVMAAALSNLDLARAPRPQSRRRLLWIGYGLSIFFVLYSLVSILRAHRP